MKYRAIVKRSDGWRIGWLLDLPGVNAQERTREEVEEIKMGLQLHIPDSVAQAMRLPERVLEHELLAELAVALYAQEILSFGKARELAGMDRYEFGQLLGRRGIPRHYGPEELADDLAYAHGNGQ